MQWVDAWNDLYDLVRASPNVRCQLPDGTVISFEDCKEWLQTSVYEGYFVRVESGYVLGKSGVVISRWKSEAG